MESVSVALFVRRICGCATFQDQHLKIKDLLPQEGGEFTKD